ncbi:MAG: hypothetical protein PHV82_02875 [Victivallaceae bacterium]|nr:hypothetical protein [Victivallaceae bacterium]
MEFDHLGLITDLVQKEETWVAKTRVWVTDPGKHPFRVEWLRFADDSPVPEPVRTQPHLAFRVSDLDSVQGLKVLLEPFDVGFARVGFYETEDNIVVEFMEYYNA